MKEEIYKVYPIKPYNKNSQMDIIFIHGLGGDKYSTWQNLKHDSWQNWLAEDYNVSVHSIAYGASMTNWLEDDMTLEETADFFLSSLKSEGIGNKPYMFIVHSLGGLLVKNILLKAQNNDDFKCISKMCKSIIFFAVPHSGSGWATLLNYGETLLRSSSLLKALSKNTPYLHQLTTNFNQLIIQRKIETYVFYETKKVKIDKFLGTKSIVVVSKESATIVHSTNQVIPLPKDHISICKIEDKDSDLYKHKIKSIMKEMLANDEKMPKGEVSNDCKDINQSIIEIQTDNSPDNNTKKHNTTTSEDIAKTSVNKQAESNKVEAYIISNELDKATEILVNLVSENKKLRREVLLYQSSNNSINEEIRKYGKNAELDRRIKQLKNSLFEFLDLIVEENKR